MSVVAFDTLRFAKRLEEAGVPPGQAAATAAAFAEATGDMIATKIEIGDLRRDLAAVRAELKANIAALRSELKADIAALRSELKGEIDALRVEVKADIAAVRRELEAVRQELKAEIAALRREFRADLRELELRMTIKLGAMCAGSVVLVAALVKLL